MEDLDWRLICGLWVLVNLATFLTYIHMTSNKEYSLKQTYSDNGSMCSPSMSAVGKDDSTSAPLLSSCHSSLAHLKKPAIAKFCKEERLEHQSYTTTGSKNVYVSIVYPYMKAFVLPGR